MSYWQIRRTALPLTIALCAAAILTGCSRTGKLTGQVFIVTQGGESVKLGLVGVGLVAERSLLDFITARSKAIEFEIANRQQDTKKALLTATASRVRMYQAYKAALASPLSERLKAEFDKAAATATAHANEYKASEAELKKAAEPSAYCEGLPAPVFATKTDADGNYSIPGVLKGERYFAVARASRNVPGNEEVYCWLVPLALEGQAERSLTLSNDNVLREGSTVGSVTLKARPDLLE